MTFRPTLALILLLAAAGPLHAFETVARAAYVHDLNTGTVMLEKDADAPLPPASMSKLMTLNMVFEALRDNRVALETRFAVSARAQAMGGSTMFLDTTDRPTVEELIKGIVVLSGNDACVVVAEGLAGTDEGFSELMTRRGREIGLENSTFANSSGWPHPDHRMSMRDLGVLATRLVTEFPEYYGYFGMTEFPWDGRAPDNRFNRNPLLRLGIGADGLKTGHTSEAGYGLVGSAVQGGRRIVFSLAGMDSEAERREEATRVVNWAFRNFTERTLLEAGATVAEAPVWLGREETVGLTVGEDLSVLLPAYAREGIEGEVRYSAPLEAPIRAGDVVGELVVRVPDAPERRAPLVAAGDVERGGFSSRLRAAARIVFQRVAGIL